MVEWLSYDYYPVLDQRCSDSPITSTSTSVLPRDPLPQRHLVLKPFLMSFYAILTKPLRNLRELRLGTPRADKAMSDPSETKDLVRSGRVKGPRALSSENDSPMTRLGTRERKFYSTLSKTSWLYGSTPRSTKASTTNVDKALSQTLRLLENGWWISTRNTE
uniref:Ulp1 protease-like n=1 Tax=Oryza sativa subsp. japonica TaxID=39947 RepID=Q653H0_ORYSJ|nr:Ulp1 protease-like [Oryza sativa Japonica Group]